MKISLLQRREDFDSIFITSLSALLKRRFNWAGEITKAKADGLVLRQNARLNVVYPHGISQKSIAPLTAEFRYAKAPLRRWLQGVYVSLATRAPLNGLASPAVFTISEPPSEVAHWIILPGNHTNRILDTKNGVSIVFPKIGFDTKFFEQDAKLRQRFAFLPAPKVLDAPTHGCWFEEERVEGLPLNRLPSAALQQKALAQAVSGLTELRAATVRAVSLQAWAAELNEKLSAILADIRESLPVETLNNINTVQTSLQQILQKADAQEISVCQSHGDFQAANILVNPEQIYLIDWEYSSERFVLYDYLVFETACRHPEGLCARLQHAASKETLSGWGLSQQGDPHGLMALFLLEDLLLRLQENAAPAIAEKGLFLDPWLAEVAQFISREATL